MTMQARAAVLREFNAPFSMEDVVISSPRSDEILVRIKACGICHTDLSVRDGLLPLATPIVLGHEGAGIVEAVGSDVTGLEPGDHVVLSFAHCGQCRPCRDKHPAYCSDLIARNLSGSRADGTNALDGLHGFFFGQSSFSTHAVVFASSAVKVRKDVDLALLAPLGCGFQTGAGTVLRKLRPSPGDSLAVFGAGAVGLSAILAARIAECSVILAVDTNAERRRLAASMGATHVLDPQEMSASDFRAMTIPDGFRFVIDTTAKAPVLDEAIKCLAPMGALALVGLAAMGQSLPVDMADITSRGYWVTGISEGDSYPQEFIGELIEHYLAGQFPLDKLTTRYAFKDIEQACSDLAAATVLKPVLIFD